MNLVFVHPIKNNGFSLLEVLISTFIFSISILALGLLQFQGIQYRHSANLRDTVNLEISNILEQMRANRETAIINRYQVDFGNFGSSGHSMDDSLKHWKKTLAAKLPGGDGKVDCTSGLCTVTVQWFDPQADKSLKLRQFSMSSQL